VRRAAALAFTCLSGVALAARFSWARLTEVLACGFALLALASLGAGLFVPWIGRMGDLGPGAWRGLWFDETVLGQYMTAGFCACAAAAALNPGRRRLWGAATALTILLVLLAASETSLASLVLAAGALGLVWLVRRGPAAGIAAAWLGVVLAIGVAGFLVLAPDRAFALFGRDATLAGRTRIWAAVLRRIHERPAVGWGYGVVPEAGFLTRRAESSWSELALGLGVSGLALWSVWFAQTILRALFALFTRRSAYLAAPYLAVYALTTLTQSVTLIWNELTWVMFVTLAVKLAAGERPPQFAAAMRASSAAP
jgi:O-antigen ligase